MNSYPPIHQIVQIVDESRRTIERSQQLIDESRRIREQTRELRLTLEELVTEQQDATYHLRRNGRRSKPNPSRPSSI